MPIVLSEQEQIREYINKNPKLAEPLVFDRLSVILASSSTIKSVCYNLSLDIV
jgi:hypothetical protein